MKQVKFSDYIVNEFCFETDSGYIFDITLKSINSLNLVY